MNRRLVTMCVAAALGASPSFLVACAGLISTADGGGLDGGDAGTTPLDAVKSDVRGDTRDVRVPCEDMPGHSWCNVKTGPVDSPDVAYATFCCPPAETCLWQCAIDQTYSCCAVGD